MCANLSIIHNKAVEKKQMNDIIGLMVYIYGLNRKKNE